jgi:hypothetical protein
MIVIMRKIIMLFTSVTLYVSVSLSSPYIPIPIELLFFGSFSFDPNCNKIPYDSFRITNIG